jgi:trans-aconitate 2-methyltransferase
MTERSIGAYDVSQRVESYDADMELMHPNRSKMVQIALELLPFPKTAALCAVDLGIGTGYFTERFLNYFPNSKVLGIDGAGHDRAREGTPKIFRIKGPICYR